MLFSLLTQNKTNFNREIRWQQKVEKRNAPHCCFCFIWWLYEVFLSPYYWALSKSVLAQSTNAQTLKKYYYYCFQVALMRHHTISYQNTKNMFIKTVKWINDNKTLIPHTLNIRLIPCKIFLSNKHPCIYFQLIQSRRTLSTDIQIDIRWMIHMKFLFCW